MGGAGLNYPPGKHQHAGREGVSMKKHFESTIEEEIEHNYRAMQFSRTIRRWRWQINYICIPAIIIFVVVQILSPWDLEDAVLFNGIFALGLFICYYPSSTRYTKKRIRKLLKEKRGTVDPQPAEVEMDDERMVCRGSDMEVAFNWAKAKSVEDRGAYIEIIFEPNTPVHLPAKIFESEEEQAGWLQFIRDRISRSALQGAQ
jgi:hypothetical protein